MCFIYSFAKRDEIDIYLCCNFLMINSHPSVAITHFEAYSLYWILPARNYIYLLSLMYWKFPVPKLDKEKCDKVFLPLLLRSEVDF